MPQLTLYTAKIEQEVDGVIDLLRRNGWSIVRHNLCDYPEHKFLTCHSGSSETSGVHWLHSLPAFSTARSLTGVGREVSIKESFAFWEGLWSSIPTSSWLNSPKCVQSASNKLAQLKAVQALDINSPDWLVTNSVDDLKAIIEKHDGEVVLKSLSCGFVSYGTENLKFYTQLATPRLVSKLHQSRLSPVIAQKRIVKHYEIRATVVCDKVYCTLLDYSALPDVIDYRSLDFSEHRRAFSSCPDELIQLVTLPSIAISDFFGLKYFGIDWVLDYSENLFFLEINPLASFKWFELCGAGDITNALAASFRSLAHAPS